ncbi:MAG TPA: hypothetical protein VNV42_15310 [Solirubrobacteraceae bacterium]|nr:hypothetical protein [Solirubrobacteraceae bacterium]
MSWRRAASLAALLLGGIWQAAPAGALTVGRSPFGLSMEYPLIERALGAGPCPSPALVATWRELGSPSLRIGGDSQDLAGLTPAYHYDVPPTLWPALGCMARETGAQITVGLNLATASPAEELAMAADAEQAVPAAQLSFSLGNEPDLYGISHILPYEPGFKVPVLRRPPWTPRLYVREWDARRALLGPVRIEGPDFAGWQWGKRLARQLAADPPDTFDVHLYPTSACGSGGARTTLARILSRRASVGLLARYGWLVRIARATHHPAIVSESNSASCGGRPGVSNAPAAGVWAARFVVSALLEGFAQVRLHSAGTSYDPLVFNANGTVTMRPLGDALLFLHRWIPVGSRIATDAGTTGGPRNPPVLAVTVSDGAHTSVIVSSFAGKPLPFSVAVHSPADAVTSETLSATSAGEARGRVAVREHIARLTLGPNTVVALETS